LIRGISFYFKISTVHLFCEVCNKSWSSFLHWTKSILSILLLIPFIKSRGSHPWLISSTCCFCRLLCLTHHVKTPQTLCSFHESLFIFFFNFLLPLNLPLIHTQLTLIGYLIVALNYLWLERTFFDFIYDSSFLSYSSKKFFFFHKYWCFRSNVQVILTFQTTKQSYNTRKKHS